MSKRKNNRNGSFTSQGVRDLSRLAGKSRGIKLEMPPALIMGECQHVRILHDEDGDKMCRDCNEII